MAHDYEIHKLPTQTDLFGKRSQLYQIICDGDALVDLCRVLRSVVGYAQRRPITSEEQNILCELYNSISLYKLKHIIK